MTKIYISEGAGPLHQHAKKMKLRCDYDAAFHLISHKKTEREKCHCYNMNSQVFNLSSALQHWEHKKLNACGLFTGLKINSLEINAFICSVYFLFFWWIAPSSNRNPSRPNLPERQNNNCGLLNLACTSLLLSYLIEIPPVPSSKL